MEEGLRMGGEGGDLSIRQRPQSRGKQSRRDLREMQVKMTSVQRRIECDGVHLR